jgi:hypothetical protein
MRSPSSAVGIDKHFENKTPAVRASYQRILEAARALGPFHEESKRTSIHLVRRTAFAGVATQKTALILTLKADSDHPAAGATRRQRTSANRWHLEFRLERPEDIDRALIRLLEKAYALAA